MKFRFNILKITTAVEYVDNKLAFRVGWDRVGRKK